MRAAFFLVVIVSAAGCAQVRDNQYSYAAPLPSASAQQGLGMLGTFVGTLMSGRGIRVIANE
jgi:hypothetical protein